MNAATNNTGTAVSPRRELELAAVVPISWAVAGGMLLGGAAVALLVLTDRLSGHALIASSAVFYVIGAILGLVHGGALALFGRREGVSLRQALGHMGHGLIWLVPVLLVGWLSAGWAAALPIVLLGHHYVAGLITLVAWIVLVLAVWAAVSAGIEATKLAYARWKDRVLGTALVGTTFAALAVSFYIERPVVWFFNVRLTGFGALLFLLGLTFWVYGPLITIGLAMLRRLAPVLPAAQAGKSEGLRRIASRGGIALGLGVLVALLALPFYAGVLGLPTDVQRFGAWQAAALALNNAVTDELAMRLFLFTAVFVLASRLLPRSSGTQWPLIIAVAAAAVGDLLIHLPSLSSLGLPGAGVAITFALARLAIPAALFGYLFWRRGLASAVTAHAAADIALGLMVL